MQARQIARQHQADLVGEDLPPLVVHHPAAISISVEA